MKWDIGATIEIVALQVVMVDLLSGETIHHAFSIPVFGTNVSTPTGDTGDMKTMKPSLQLRWLIIDEICMVSARLLADVDTKLRSFARAVNPYVKEAYTNPRPCAGLTILCSGDVWQLPPLDGGLLGDIPCELIQASRTYYPAPTVAHGQSLLWSDAPTGMTGVTELQQCERTKDAWLRSIHDKFRFSNLSEETHAFLHGAPTMQPGSIVHGNIMCGNKNARQYLLPQHVIYTSINNSQKQPNGWSVSSAKKNASLEYLWLTQAMIRFSKKNKCVHSGCLLQIMT